jgi:hypothetical protein
MDAYFEELMTDAGIKLIHQDGNIYAIRVLGRGLNLFFRENEKGLICQIDAEHGVIYKRSIKLWDTTNKRMNPAEKERVFNLIFTFYQQFYNADVVVSLSLNY